MVHVNKSKINYDGIPFWKIVTNIKKKRDGCIYGFYLDYGCCFGPVPARCPDLYRVEKT